MILVASMHRRIQLDASPADGTEVAILGIPIGSTSRQVLGWAREVLPPSAVAELEQEMRAAGDDLG